MSTERPRLVGLEDVATDVPSAGARVVLVIPRDDSAALPGALDHITRCGWHLVAVVDPQDHLQALRMVVEGAADVVLATQAEHLPVLQLTGRTTRADFGGSRYVATSSRTRRPRLVS